MEKFAERFTNQNPSIFPTADVAFILAFSIIMLNTDLHNPSIKEDRRMTKEGFVRNNRGICDGQDLPEEMLITIFDRIKKYPISLKEDDEARQKVGDGNDAGSSIQTALSPAVFFSSHYDDLDKDRENNFQKERDQIVRTTESLLRRKRQSTHSKGDESGTKHTRHKSMNGKSRSIRFVRTEDTGLRDEYVAPMFEVTWGPALAAFSTAMESANGTIGALLAIATDEELEHAAENAAETIEVCLTGFRFAVCTAGLCGNETARDSFMFALSRFTQLGSGTMLEPRHVRCVQTLLSLGKDDGELLGTTWEHVFKALSEIHRFHELFQVMARNDRAAAAATERRRKRLEVLDRRKREREERRKAASESGDSADEDSDVSPDTDDGSMTDEELFSDDEEFLFDEEMDKREIDEANARVVYDAVSEALIDAIYQRSSSLSGPSIKEFVFQLCRVSRMEISGYGGHAGSEANTVDLTQTHYRKHHTLMNGSSHGTDQPHHNQPNIYNLQKLVEVTHYNMDSRPRLVFSDIWTTVAAHLTSTALHSNAAVAMYAVDSFRQLSTQYLQREELGGFEFQRKFLKPFEIVMSKSGHVSVKELLLKCVERIIMKFGAEEDTEQSQYVGTLRSGWRPILAVLGLAGRDADERVAKMGFTMLTSQLRQCLSVEKDAGGVDKPRAGNLLAERFVDLVDALLMYVSGPHEEMSLVSIDHLVTLTTFLADESFALPLAGRRATHLAKAASAGEASEGTDDELELWWPILLGISRSMGDPRKQVRLKSMITLLGIINEHFFPKENSVTDDGEAPKHGDMQTLQLIFRGILTPVLEHADSDAHMGPSPPLPNDFERFATKPPAPLAKDKRNSTWLETTFEHFMDGCIALCMRSVEVFKDDSLVEEIFAMLNSCTLSDSGGLAVRGLRRLEQFVTKDLDPSVVTDDTWATVCHMLRRCLSVRGLPQSDRVSPQPTEEEAPKSESSDETEEPADNGDYEESIREFILEEKIMQDRRYIGSNVTMIIGSLLTSGEYSESMGLRWKLFLTSGLGRGVKEWEEAGTLLANRAADTAGPSP
jgi:brefeldin A-inhibited guanine nucleotide-exchange protein